MENIKRVHPFKIDIKKTDVGILTTLITEHGISAHGNISCNQKSLLANYIDQKGETYHLVYTVIDPKGNEESFAENDGILPTLFLSPGEENYVSVVPYHPDKELEISIPVFNREHVELPKGNRPFTGKFIGVANQYAILYEVDIWSDKKPDKLLAIEFKNNMIKKKHNIKVPLPRDNRIFVNNNEIHLLAKDENGWLHRLIDEKGNITKSRTITPNQEYPDESISLSFEENSYILCRDEGQFTIEIISPEGNCITKPLIDIGDPVFNTWLPVCIAENTFVTRFNNEFGNGWLTTKKDELLEVFFSKDTKGYKNLLTGEILEMEDEQIVLSGLNKTAENAYAVVFYPMSERGGKNKKLIVLNRTIK